MTRIAWAALLAVTSVLGAAPPAASEQAAVEFPQVPVPSQPKRSGLPAYVAMAAGVGLIAGSFPIATHANQTYDRYLATTDPGEIEHLYDETVAYDRLSSASLITGEVLIATGLYLRFLRRPAAGHASLIVGERRCALSWRF